VSLTLQGCGGGGGGTTPAPTPSTPAPTPPPTPSPTTGPAPDKPLPSFVPIKAITYVSPPCKGLNAEPSCAPQPPADLVQVGYENQWGESGRDDLGTISRLNANAVRVYEAFGSESHHSHKEFLDRAQSVGLHVMPGFTEAMVCDDFDCYQSWYDAAMAAFKLGYLSGSKWHTAIPMIVLMNEPNTLNFEGTIQPPTVPTDPADKAVARVKAALSALDGFLKAEKDFGVTDTDKVNITIAWGWESLNSIDNVITSKTYYGFQDMIAGVGNPSLAGYKLKGVTQTELMDSYRTRWTNSLNSPSPWHFIQETVDVDYDNYFGGTPWFLSAFKDNDESQDDMEKDFTDTLEESSGGGPFLGVTFMQFQTAYYPQVNGMFDLGTAKIGNGTTGYVCQEDVIRHTPVCERRELFCLESKTPSRIPQAVASAWGGSFESRGFCDPSKSEQLIV